MHATLEKFGYPSSLLADYRHWAVVIRPNQVTAGCVVLICKEDATSLPDISDGAFSELRTVTSDIEGALRAAFSFNKINYLALMMVDKHVHFHVIPRYAEPREFGSTVFKDAGWPKHPALGDAAPMTGGQLGDLRKHLISYWRSISG